MKTSTFDRSSKLYATTLLGLTSFFLVFMYLIPPRLKWLAGVVSMIAFVAYVTSVASLIYKGTLAAPEDDSDSDSDDDVNSNGSSSDEDEHTCEPKRLSRSRSFSPGSNPANCELVPSAPARVGRRARSRGPPREAKPFWRCIVRLLVGLAALLLSSYIISHSAGTIADELGLSETVVGMTILSVATTLPEKFIAIMGGVRHQPEILVANTVGSNIFLVTLCAGVMFIWGDAEKLGLGFTFFEALAMWASSALVLLVVLGGGKRWIGAVFLGLYVAFFTVEFVNGRRLDED
jgi:Ca2+/Na+ antiporter